MTSSKRTRFHSQYSTVVLLKSTFIDLQLPGRLNPDPSEHSISGTSANVKEYPDNSEV